jgi:hypothetical protein
MNGDFKQRQERFLLILKVIKELYGVDFAISPASLYLVNHDNNTKTTGNPENNSPDQS